MNFFPKKTIIYTKANKKYLYIERSLPSVEYYECL